MTCRNFAEDSMIMTKQFLGFFMLLAFALISCSGNSQSDYQGGMLTLVDVEEASSLMLNEELVLIDVRTPAEVSSGYIEGALHWDFYEWKNFVANAKTLDKSKPVMVYCKAGGRSGKVANYLKEQGFERVYDIRGGMNAWLAQSKPVIKN